jgi:serine/threonine protein kinase
MNSQKAPKIKNMVYLKSVEQYRLTKEIGVGAYGKVYQTIDINNNNTYATKVVDKKILKDGKMMQCFHNEMEIISKLNHQNIIKLFDTKETANNYYLIMELCKGWSLRKLVDYYKKNPNFDTILKEKHIQHIIKQLCMALEYIYNLNIIHRDIKLDNVLLHFSNDHDKEFYNILNSVIKLIDFGFSRHLDKGQVASTICGSPLNMAPQILNNIYNNDERADLCYDQKADLWSLGSLVFELLVGKPPFEAQNLDELKRIVKIGSYNLPNKLKVSKEIISFLCGLLQENPDDRMKLEELIRHDFLVKNVEEFQFVDLTRSSSTQLKTNKKYIMNLLFEDDQINQIDNEINTKIRKKNHTKNETVFNENLHKNIKLKEANIDKDNNSHEKQISAEIIKKQNIETIPSEPNKNSINYEKKFEIFNQSPSNNRIEENKNINDINSSERNKMNTENKNLDQNINIKENFSKFEEIKNEKITLNELIETNKETIKQKENSIKSYTKSKNEKESATESIPSKFTDSKKGVHNNLLDKKIKDSIKTDNVVEKIKNTEHEKNIVNPCENTKSKEMIDVKQDRVKNNNLKNDEPHQTKQIKEEASLKQPTNEKINNNIKKTNQNHKKIISETPYHDFFINVDSKDYSSNHNNNQISHNFIKNDQSINQKENVIKVVKKQEVKYGEIEG